ncbi:MFS transporter [Kitasatospora griseola]|uniref:hypothetical protein n=1 Tax=Kitasatospora griseola TaxID=2064 RepID=UPI00365C3AA7
MESASVSHRVATPHGGWTGPRCQGGLRWENTPGRANPTGTGTSPRSPSGRRWASAWRPDPPPPSTVPVGPGEGGYRAVPADRRYLLVVAADPAFGLSCMALAVLIALPVTQAPHLSVSVAGALLVLNGVQVVVTRSPVSRLLEGVRPTRAVAVGSALNALAFAGFAALPGPPVGTGSVAAMPVYSLAGTVATPGREELGVALAQSARRGRCPAVDQLSWSIGQALAPGLLTLLFVHGPAWPWLFLPAVPPAAVPAFLLLERLTSPFPTFRRNPERPPGSSMPSG